MSVIIAGLGSGVVVLAVRPLWFAIILVLGSQAIYWFGSQMYHVLQVPVRYALADEALHGRVNATIRTTVWGLAPVGAFGGGLLGAAIGVRATLAVSAMGAALAAAVIILSRAWRYQPGDF